MLPAPGGFVITVRTNVGVIDSKKFAVTVLLVSMVSVIELLVPLASPVQFVKAKFNAGVAVRLTTVPSR